MRRNSFLCLLVIPLVTLLVACGNENPPPENENPVGDVRTISHNEAMRIFNQKCALCHGKDGTKQLAGAKDLSKTKLTKKEIMALIRYGKGAMPPFKDQLSKAEIEAVATYLNTFEK